jgi:hypothetical protein
MSLNSNTSYEHAKSHKETPAEYTARKQQQAERTNKKETPVEYASRKAWIKEKTHKKETPVEYASRKAWIKEKTHNKETPEEYAARKQQQSERTHKKESLAEYAARKARMQEKINLMNKQTIPGLNGGPGFSHFNPAFTYNSNVGFYVDENPDATRYYKENEDDHSKYSKDLYENNTHYYEENRNPHKYHPVGKGRWWNKNTLSWGPNPNK